MLNEAALVNFNFAGEVYGKSRGTKACWTNGLLEKLQLVDPMGKLLLLATYSKQQVAALLIADYIGGDRIPICT